MGTEIKKEGISDMAYIFQYYVVEDKDYHTDSYDGVICDIHAGPFHSRHAANEWIYNRRQGAPARRVVRAKVEVRLC